MRVITRQTVFTFFFTALWWYQTPTKPRKSCEILASVGMLFEVSNDVQTTSERRIVWRQRASKPRPQSFNICFYRNSFHFSFIFLSFYSHVPFIFLSLYFHVHVPFIFLSLSFHYPFSFLLLSFQFPSIILSVFFHYPFSFVSFRFFCFLPLLPHRFSIPVVYRTRRWRKFKIGNL